MCHVNRGYLPKPWTPSKRRGPIAAERSSPGPARYLLPALTGEKVPESTCGRIRGPAYSIKGHIGNKYDTLGPGPGKYDCCGFSSRGKATSPAWSLHYRHSEKRKDTMPASTNYDAEQAEKKVLPHAPEYSFRLKTKIAQQHPTPAPNVYMIPSVLGPTKEGKMRQAPAYTITGRFKALFDERVHVPGPGMYETIKPGLYKQKAPEYSLGTRFRRPVDHTRKPGPGAHSPEKIILNSFL